MWRNTGVLFLVQAPIDLRDRYTVGRDLKIYLVDVAVFGTNSRHAEDE